MAVGMSLKKQYDKNICSLFADRSKSIIAEQGHVMCLCYSDAVMMMMMMVMMMMRMTTMMTMTTMMMMPGDHEHDEIDQRSEKGIYNRNASVRRIKCISRSICHN